jgi:type II secretory pathway component PulM
MQQVVRVGGSNAQRQVIEDTLLQAYIRAGRCQQAAQLLQVRLARRPSRRDAQWLEQVQQQAISLGLKPDLQQRSDSL